MGFADLITGNSRQQKTSRRRSLVVEALETRWTPAWAGVPPIAITPPANPVNVVLNSSGDAAGNAAVSSAEVDYYRLVAPTSGSYRISVATPISNLDPVLGVFSAAGRRLSYNDDISDFNTNSRLTVNLTAGSQYYVGITKYTGTSSGWYRWTIDGPAAPVPGIDLAGAALSADDQGVFGQPITVAAAVRNNGTVASGAFSTEWWLSKDRIWSADDIILTDLAGVGNRIFSGLAAGAVSATRTVTLSLPPALPDGWNSSSVYLVMRTDAGNLVAETNENNNTGQVGLGRDYESLSISDSLAGQFQITLNIAGMTASQRAVFQTAANRWAEVIVGDLPNATYNGITVDDVRIDARSMAIDGPGGTLGQAGPDRFRSGSFLPIHGGMEFDSADLAEMEAEGSLFDVVLHEMGHVLGVGTIWEDLGLLRGAGTSNPIFIGARATAEYNSLFGLNAAGVPVENGGGRGTRDSHWRESVFGNEVMTGYVDAGINPLSRITAASLADLGYLVNMSAADAFARSPVFTTSAVAEASTDAPAVISSSPAASTDRRLAALEAALAHWLAEGAEHASQRPRAFTRLLDFA